MFYPRIRYTKEEIELAIKNDDWEELRLIPIWLGEYCSDYDYAVGICIRLLKHEDDFIRVEAIRGLSFIAKNHKRIPKRIIPRIIEEYNSNWYYRDRIKISIDDITLFSGIYIDIYSLL